MLKDLIKNAQSPWTIGAGDDKDVVLYSFQSGHPAYWLFSITPASSAPAQNTESANDLPHF